MDKYAPNGVQGETLSPLNIALSYDDNSDFKLTTSLNGVDTFTPTYIPNYDGIGLTTMNITNGPKYQFSIPIGAFASNEKQLKVGDKIYVTVFNNKKIVLKLSSILYPNSTKTIYQFSYI